MSAFRKKLMAFYYDKCSEGRQLNQGKNFLIEPSLGGGSGGGGGEGGGLPYKNDGGCSSYLLGVKIWRSVS